MAMGRSDSEQEELFVSYGQLRKGGGHPFYEALNKVLRKQGFDQRVEKLCKKYYAKDGRPSIPPGLYFRCLLVGFFEGIGSERGIAWRVADSMSLRSFLGLPLSKHPPDHSTISRNRRLIPSEAHEEVFTWVLAQLAEHDLVKGKTLGVDATTLEANAAMRSIERRDTGKSYNDYLEELAKAEGVEEPTREDLTRVDKKRPKKGSNKDWVNPYDPDAEIMKMKDGRTHLAHKHEQAVDMETGAVVAVNITGGAKADTKSIGTTLEKAQKNLDNVKAQVDDEVGKNISDFVEEAVADKGYHSNATLLAMQANDIRTYVSEPNRGRRNWEGKVDAKAAVYGNRRRIRGDRGKQLLRQRGELLERPFAHELLTGGLRRTHVRGHEEVAKRLLIQAAALNLGLLMRSLFGVGTPRSLQGRTDLVRALLAAISWAVNALRVAFDRICRLWSAETRSDALGRHEFPPQLRIADIR